MVSHLTVKTTSITKTTTAKKNPLGFINKHTL